MKYKRGSITILLSMILTVMISLEFTLIEVVRIRGMKQRVERVSYQITESLFSEYNPYLWEKYGVLMMDGNYGERLESDIWNENQVCNRAWDFAEQNQATNFLQSACSDIQVSEYGMITDEQGEAFITQGAKAMESEIATEALEKWKEQALATQQSQGQKQDMESLLEQGEEALAQAKEMQATQELQETQEVYKSQVEADIQKENFEDTKNPMEVVKEWKTKGILSTVIPSTIQLSEKAMDVTSVVSKRNLTQGNVTQMNHKKIYETLLYEQYLLYKFQSYCNPLEHTKMAYELEYILCGKESDKENLEAVITRLIGIREIENYSAILLDKKKRAEALALATTYAGASGNPAIVKAVELGVIAAWALIESILDVRLLLKGGKVSFLKTPTEWTSDLYQISNYMNVNVTAKECEQGLSYDNYMMALLFLLSRRNLGLRPLDLMEQELHQQEEYVNVQMDHMIYQIQLLYEYQSEPLFFSFVPSLQGKNTIYHFKQTRTISY